MITVLLVVLLQIDGHLLPSTFISEQSSLYECQVRENKIKAGENERVKFFTGCYIQEK